MKVNSIVIWGLIVLVFLTLFPFGLNLAANQMKIISQATFDGWLGFLGSYIGGIVSGAITLIGVLIGFQFERSKNLARRYLSVSVEIEELGQHLEDDIRAIPTIYKLSDKESKVIQEGAKNWFENKREKYKKYEKICGSIDIPLLKEIKEFNGYLFNLYYEFEMSLSDDEKISESGKRNFNEDFENLKQSKNKLQKKLKELESISMKYY